MGEIESRIAQATVEGIVFVAEFPGRDRRRDPLQGVGVEAERLAHLARRHAVAIGDDIGRHRRPTLTVALVEILDHALTLVAARQIEIDIRPLASFFGKKTLEQQLHADRVHRRDAERIADHAVRGRSPALHQDVLLAAKAHQVPDDQEISFKAELPDQRQFALDLAVGAAFQFRLCPAVPALEAFPRALAKKRNHGLAFRHGIARKFVSQIVQRKFEPRGKLGRVRNCFRKIRKECLHLARRLEIPLRVARQQPVGRGQRAAMAERCECVRQFPLSRRGVIHTVGGQ